MQPSPPPPASPTPSSASTPIPTLLLLLRHARKALYQADSSARNWLRTHTTALSYAGDLLHTLALVSPSAHAHLRTELAATIVSLLHLYRDFPPALPPTSAASPFSLPAFQSHHRLRLLVLNLLTAVQLFVEMSVKPSSSAFPAGAAATSHLNTLTAIESAKAALRLSLLSPLARMGRPLTADAQALPQAPAPPDCVCGLRDIPNAQSIAVRKGPRNDRAILQLRHHRRLLSRLNVTNVPSKSRPIPRPPPTRQRPLSTARIEGLSPPSSMLMPHLGAPPDMRPSRDNNNDSTVGNLVREDDVLLEALFVVAYERRSNWIFRAFMPDLRCPACTNVVNLSPPPLSDTLHNLHSTLTAMPPHQIAAEAAYILRPVVHLLLIRRFGWRSWRAWATALILDLASRFAMTSSSAPRAERHDNNSGFTGDRRRLDDPADGDEDGNDSIAAERRRRMAQLLLYLGRSPLFDVILRAFVRKLTAPLHRVPLVGGFTSSAIQWVTLLQQYWFYTSGS